MISAERLRELVAYDAATGIFTWLVDRANGIKAWTVAGHVWVYARLKIDGRIYLSHRLAFLWMTGEWPAEDIDHRNGVRTDNRWENLRKTNDTLNQQNRRRAQSNSTTGLIGAMKPSGSKGFRARIRVNGVRRNLGDFSTAELAHAAYVAAKRQLHPGNTI